MRQWRWFPLLLVTLLTVVILSPLSRAEETDPHLELSEDRQTIRLLDAKGEVPFEYTFAQWRKWAEAHLVEALGEPVRIGEQEMPPSTFGGFGAATLSPSGRRLALSATTYAMLTEVSVVGILELDDAELSVVDDPAFGWAEDFHWSPDARFLGYALGTARAEGDRLRVDDLVELRPAVEVEGEDLVRIARQQGVEAPQEARKWLPRIRELEWTEGGRLLFTTDGLTDGELRWSVEPRSGELTLE